jgi:hypothetical protein
MSPARGWHQVSRESVSRSGLSSSESKMHCLSKFVFGRAMIVSLARDWPRVSHDYISSPRLTSGEFPFSHLYAA